MRFKHNHTALVIYIIKLWRLRSVTDCFEGEGINVKMWILFVCICSSQNG